MERVNRSAWMRLESIGEGISHSEEKGKTLSLIDSTLADMEKSGLDLGGIPTFLNAVKEAVSGGNWPAIPQELREPDGVYYWGRDSPAQYAMGIANYINKHMEGNKRLEYRHRLLMIAHELGHFDAAYQLATSLKRTNHFDSAMEWYRKVPDSCSQHQRVQQRLNLFDQTKAILGASYVSNQSPEQNWQYAIQEGRFPTHPITVSGVCFAFKTPKTIRLPDTVTLDSA